MNNIAGHIILIVDDDSALRASIRVILETYGYDIIEAGDSEEALRVIETTRLDLVVTDIYMPGIDGYELINALRNRAAQVPPIIAMSGGSHFTDVDQLKTAEKLGAVAFIDKPFRVNSLVEMIGRVIAEHSASAQR